jgi:RNA polymerase sigma-70 factor, ECF subfamily
LQRDKCPAFDNKQLDHAEDRCLVDRLLTRDAAAWRTFLENYGRLVRSRVADVARSFGCSSDSTAIDEATADVFSSLVANDIATLRAYAGRSSLVTYLAVIATRCATRNFARKRYQTRKQANFEAVELLTSVGTDPAGGVLQAETRQQIQALLEELPEKQRDVVRLFHLEGQSYAAISTALGMPIGSVGVTLRRAEAKLREQFEPPQG